MKQATTLAAVIFSSLLLARIAAAANDTATLMSKANRVEMASSAGSWSAARDGQTLHTGDRLRTGEDSRATVRMGDGSVLQLDELTTIEITPPTQASASATLNVPSGAAFFFNRGSSREIQVQTPSANGAIRGTAFLLTVNRGDGRTAVSMIDGAFELSNSGGTVTAREGDQARADSSAPATGRYSDAGNSAPWYLVIENHLPAVQNLRHAGKAQVLSALPDAIRQYRQVAPQLSGGATIARKELALQILEKAFEAVGPDCGMRARILKSIIAADPEEAAALTDRAIALGPDCASAFGGGGGASPASEGSFGEPPVLNNFGNPPGISGGGQGNVIAICHNGQTIFLSPEDAERQLRNNPGDTLGQCQVTPVQNR